MKFKFFKHWICEYSIYTIEIKKYKYRQYDLLIKLFNQHKEYETLYYSICKREYFKSFKSAKILAFEFVKQRLEYGSAVDIFDKKIINFKNK